MRPNLPKTTFVNVVISFSYHFVKNYAKRGLSKFVRARGTSYAAHLRPGIISQSLDYQPLPTLTNLIAMPAPATIKRILLVEDSQHDAELTMVALEECHLANHVDLVHDGAEALDYLYRRGAFANRTGDNPIVVLLDLKMPKVDGLEVLRQMKSDAALKHIPVVMLTSSREERDLVRSYELGVNAYVVKPVDFQQFIESVKQLGCFWAIINEPAPVDSSSA